MNICVRRAQGEDKNILLELTLKEFPSFSPTEVETHVRTELNRGFANGQYYILDQFGISLAYTLIGSDYREVAFLNLKEFYFPSLIGGKLFRELMLDSEFSYRNTYTQTKGIQPVGILTRFKKNSEERERRLHSVGYEFFASQGEQEIWRKLFTTLAQDIRPNPGTWRGKF